MNSEDAARLAFGNPGFLDFLGNIGQAALGAVIPGFGTARQALQAVAPAVRGTPIEGLVNAANVTGNVVEKIAGTIIPSTAITSVFTNIAGSGDDGTGPNEVDDQVDGPDDSEAF